jgi:hypothetical protein
LPLESISNLYLLLYFVVLKAATSSALSTNQELNTRKIINFQTLARLKQCVNSYDLKFWQIFPAVVVVF